VIVTVTLNPAVDEEFIVSDFQPGGWFRSNNANRSPGGKGINVSLLMSQLGYETAAMGFLAGFNGAYIRDVLRREKITTNFVHVRGETRTNVYIVDDTGQVETGISEPGPFIPDEASELFMTNYQRMLKRADLVVMGGSLPPGVPQDIYGRLVSMAREQKVPVWIDAAGAPLMAGLKAGPDVAKIDHRFMSKVLGLSLTSLDNLIEVVSRLHDRGIGWAIASYHTYGDVFFTPDGIYLGIIDRRSVISVFGASDALMAGMVLAWKENMGVEETIRFAMASAWEDASHVEKGFRNRESIEEKMSLVKVEKLK